MKAAFSCFSNCPSKYFDKANLTRWKIMDMRNHRHLFDWKRTDHGKRQPHKPKHILVSHSWIKWCIDVPIADYSTKWKWDWCQTLKISSSKMLEDSRNFSLWQHLWTWNLPISYSQTEGQFNKDMSVDARTWKVCHLLTIYEKSVWEYTLPKWVRNQKCELQRKRDRCFLQLTSNCFNLQ